MRTWQAAALAAIVACCACCHREALAAGSGGQRHPPGSHRPAAGRRELVQEPAENTPPAPVRSPVYWSVLRACHGGGLLTGNTTGLRYISVPHAVLMGTTLSKSTYPTEEGCAAACTATRSCVMYNYCPPGSPKGCEMNTGLFVEPERTCYLLQQTVVQSATFLPLLGNGSAIATTAGAPIVVQMEAVPAEVGGYFGNPGLGFFGSGNIPCPQSFQESMCALPGEPAELAAACDAQPGCIAFTLVSQASPLLSSTREDSTIGILKRSVGTLSYSPFTSAFAKLGQAAAPLAVPSCAAPPPQPGGHRAASWSVLRRFQGGLHVIPTNDGDTHAIVAPHTLLPGSQVSSITVEGSFDACLRRCVAHPDCTCVNFCPSELAGGCRIGTLGIAGLPSGACSLLWEESVANKRSVAVLATGEGMSMLAGIPDTVPANRSLPGYRQHLGQALLDSYDIPADLCPGSLRPNYCQLEGSLEEIAELCWLHPNCSAFTWRVAGLEVSNSTGVLKMVAHKFIDPSRVNWNPGASLYVKDGVGLDDAAPLPTELAQHLHFGAGTVANPPAAAAGLGPGAIAGVVLGSVAVVAVAAAAAVLWWRRRRPKAGHSPKRAPLQLLTIAGTTPGGPSGPGGPAPLKARSSLPFELPEVQLSESGAVQLASSSDGTLVQRSGKRRASASLCYRGASALGTGDSSVRVLAALEGGLQTALPGADPAPSGESGSIGRDTGGIGSIERDDALSSGALQTVTRLMDASPGWEEMLVPESAVTFMEGENGRRVVLGQGGFGAVYKVLLHGHTVCAAKILEWEGADHLHAMFVQEASMMRRLQHPNIVQFMGICMSDTRGTLLMEYCAGRDLDAAMQARTRTTGIRLLDWAARGRRVAQDVAAGLAYLHDRKILHLDVKPHNILLTREGVAKIGDVGLARLCNRTHLSLGGQFGTLDYAAPEVLLGQGATYAADIWSFGVMLFQIITGERPRRGQMRLLHAPEECPAAIADLQLRCVAEDPGQRPTAFEVLDVLRADHPSRRPLRALSAMLPPPPPGTPNLSGLQQLGPAGAQLRGSASPTLHGAGMPPSASTLLPSAFALAPPRLGSVRSSADFLPHATVRSSADFLPAATVRSSADFLPVGIVCSGADIRPLGTVCSGATQLPPGRARSSFEPTTLPMSAFALAPPITARSSADVPPPGTGQGAGSMAPHGTAPQLGYTNSP